MVKAGVLWQEGSLKIEGLSLSGIRTAFALPEYSVGLDVAQGYPFSLNLKVFGISHGHLDHAAGIPYIISQKAMHSQKPGIFLMPPSLVEPLSQIMDLWEKIEGHEYDYDFVPVHDKFKYELNAKHSLQAFKTVHRIESFGYAVIETNKKLKPEYQNLHPAELKKLGESGIELQNFIDTPLVAFTGDTQIEFLDESPWVKNAKVLLMECTYLDNQKSIEHARKWGHTHIDEIVPRLNEINSDKILLIHSSSRYTYKEALELLANKIPSSHRDRVVLFPGR
ncbi:MAG: MBL fold metallo-hydrolase [Bdellovibrionia bacterium]